MEQEIRVLGYCRGGTLFGSALAGSKYQRTAQGMALWPCVHMIEVVRVLEDDVQLLHTWTAYELRVMV